MSTSHYFNGKLVKLPGSYSAVKSLSPQTNTTSTYGKVLVVNSDPSNSFGGAINGELTKGANSLYRLRSLGDAQSLLRTGKLFHVTQPLFQPSRSGGVNGISELYYINALTTTAPVITPTFTSPATLSIKVKDEGTTSNGVTGSSYGLATGYGLTIVPGVKNIAKYIFKFWRGTFRGLAPDGIPYDEINLIDSRPELIVQSPEVATMAEFIAWTLVDETFNQGFSVASHTDTPSGPSYSFLSSDLTGEGYELATGGTASYASSDLEAALLVLKELDFNTLLVLDKVGDGGTGDSKALRLQYFIQSEVKGEKFLALPGKEGNLSADLTSNINLSKTFNSDRVWLTHGRIRKKSSASPLGYRNFDTVFLNAMIVGRILGLPPQIPVTFKDLNIDGIEFPLNELQQEDALDGGLLVPVWDNELEAFTVLRGVNTLKNNTSLQNPDGTSFSIQLTRISAQLNTDLYINAKKTFFSREDGSNRFSLSPEYLSDWTDTFLKSKVATTNQDNLIISYREISVVRESDAYRVSYKFEPNNEIAFIFFTGFSIS